MRTTKNYFAITIFPNFVAGKELNKNFNGYKDKWESDEKYLNWCYEWIDLCIQKLKGNGAIYLMGATQFIPYFENQRRIEVVFVSGTVKRGRVGITTGWRPAFLLMLRSTSIGSQYILRDSDRIVKEI